jgi:hypothetical protein
LYHPVLPAPGEDAFDSQAAFLEDAAARRKSKIGLAV